MTGISSSIEGELLIRAILSGRAAADSDCDVLRIKADVPPSPTLPQMAAKSGFQRLEIIAGNGTCGHSAPKSLRWQGIDGTQIDTRLQCAAGPLEATTVAFGQNSKDVPIIWYDELPALRSAPCKLNERDRQHLGLSLRNAEFLNVIKPTGIANYPQTKLLAAWNCLLASSTDDTQPDDNHALLQAISEVESETAAALAELSDGIDTRGLKRPILVINNNSFYAYEAVAIPLAPGEKPVTAIGPEGDAEQVQILQNPNGDGMNYAVFVAKNVPLHGYAVWDLDATLTLTVSDDEATASPTHLENSSFRIEFDRTTGLIIRIFDKDNERDLLNDTFEVQRSGKRDLLLEECANLLELTAGGEAPMPIIHLDRAEVLEAGPVRAAIRFTRTLPGGRSTILQTVRLTARNTRIDFMTEVDWHERDQALSVAFPVAINSTRASYDIPFGYVDRPTHCNRPAAAVFDYEEHSWVDLSEGDYGIALLNDGRCGCTVSGNRLLLNLISHGSSTNPENNLHALTYSLLPHGGDLRDGEVVENSFSVTNPSRCIAITGNRPGKLPLERSFFEVDSASIFIDVIKRSEKEEKALIVRLHEAHNTRGVVLLTTALPVKRAWLCDLLENTLAEIPLDNGEALLPFHPFEIITVKYNL